MAPDGTFVITWTSAPISTSNMNTPNAEIFAREYNADGTPVNNSSATAAFQPGGSAFQVSSTAKYAQSLSDVAMDANDDFVITWEGDNQSSSWGVYGAYYTNGGAVSQRHNVSDEPGSGTLEQYAEHARQFHRNRRD